jgi:two-component system NtrC family sensor kinase
MRIATRLWLALLLKIVVVLAAGVFVRVREEQRFMLELTLRDRRFFAHALQHSLSKDHAASDPLADARALLASEEIAAAHVVARLVATESALGLPTPRLPVQQTAPLSKGKVVVGVYGDELLTYIPLQADARVAIELAEPHAVDKVLERIGWRALISQATVLVTLAGAITFVLVRWLIGRPLASLAALARQLGAGDLSARVKVKQGPDEVAVLGREMNRMAEQLEAAHQALDELNVQRVTALEQLRHADRLRTVGQLASALAHELGTPLNVVSGHARMIEESPSPSPEVTTSARAILEQGTRMTRILKDLLGFARRRSTRMELHDLGALAEDAARTLEPLARRQRINMLVERARRGANVFVNPQHVLQVLTNLITNAMHAMPHGGDVRVVVDELDAESPTGVHAPRGRYARVSVIDHGVGIDSIDLPHLFEPFFTRAADGEGTGLGLAVVEGIVKEHKGWVQVHSERGGGSRFEVFLPRAPDAETPALSELA